MHILINNEEREAPEGCALQTLIESLQLAGKRIAVERNGEIIPRSLYAQTRLASGDRLEIVQAVGGG